MSTEWTEAEIAGHRVRYRPIEQPAGAPGRVEIMGVSGWVSVSDTEATMFAMGIGAARQEIAAMMVRHNRSGSETEEGS